MAVRALTIALSFVDATGAPAPTHNEIKVMWSIFKAKYNKVYPSQSEEPLKVFEDNVMRAHSKNEEQGAECVDYFEGPECVFGITKFSAMTPAEFAKTKLGYKRSGNALNASVLSSLPLVADAAVDWRKKGAVTAVKDQGQCGSCWAFSTTETIESQLFMKTGKLDKLSTQQIISCDKVDQGCDGGDPPSAYAYVKKAGGLDAAADYPDKSHVSGNTGKCSWDHKKEVTVTSFAYAVKPCNQGACKNQDEVGLATALAAKGPISICVNAAASGWQTYQRGIFSAKCSGAASDLDHCVQLVGYNKKGPKPYWIVRNSWAADWGVGGYMYLEMGKNLCGVADEATIPHVAASVQMSPNGLACTLCQEFVKEAVGKGLAECNKLCKEKGGVLDGVCESACAMIGKKATPTEVCSAVHLCSTSESIVV